MSPFRFVNPSSLAQPRGYNNGALAATGEGRELLFIAGQVGWDEAGHLTGPSLAEQFEQALANVVAVAKAAGGAADSIGKLTIFVLDVQEYLRDRAAIGNAYRRHMGRHYPAMSLVEVKALVEPGARVEIEGFAVIERRSREIG
jgi:enamine deaminase RidA (YjgF/YER057c/UK114 family)